MHHPGVWMWWISRELWRNWRSIPQFPEELWFCWQYFDRLWILLFQFLDMAARSVIDVSSYLSLPCYAYRRVLLLSFIIRSHALALSVRYTELVFCFFIWLPGPCFYAPLSLIHYPSLLNLSCCPQSSIFSFSIYLYFSRSSLILIHSCHIFWL